MVNESADVVEKKVMIFSYLYIITQRRRLRMELTYHWEGDYLIPDASLDDGKSGVQIFLELGQEVALRNRYIKDEYLTRINNAAIREIFKSQTKRPWYLSTDIEHGAIEVCDENGHHIDEYTYEGAPQNKQDKSRKHDIKLKR